MKYPRRAMTALFVVLASVIASVGASSAQRGGDDRKPSLSLKANPPVGFSPLRVRLVVDLKNGANDYQEYYCPGVQWDWGDGTVSENSEDCDPYQAGKSEIRRRFTVEHVFRRPENYRVTFRLKRHDKAVGQATTQIQVRPGMPEGR